MTKIRSVLTPGSEGEQGSAWSVHEAKARFSELIRQARYAGPQVVTVHGKDAAVVLGIDAYERLLGTRGVDLIALCTDSPHRDVDLQTVVGSAGVDEPS
ncbi:MAG: type II toxin-antitoxin system Phd/YefM family antitoxin [Lautropia sp.]